MRAYVLPFVLPVVMVEVSGLDESRRASSNGVYTATLVEDTREHTVLNNSKLIYRGQ